MSWNRFTAPMLAAAISAATLFLAPTFASASPEDLQQVMKMELEGDKVGAYLKLKELAPQGDPIAQYKLAGYYQYGWASPANFGLARQWYGRAAKQGSPDAMLGLAIMDAMGQGGPVNKKSAFVWLTIASQQLKDPKEIKNVNGLRDKYKAEMSSADLNAALAEAMAFQPVLEHP
ncbi:tetratricopeptide repeat protein [Dongia sp.]|uniref:tetratricopeptide repeat protein n=1 Tax=Dongia sp. TaxID=1977262 RepID=UPI0035B16D60